jgi:aspartate carbamoyltransferase catalytic subunit
MLRLQQERMQKGLLPPVGAYYRAFGLTPRSIAAAAPNALIIHPGPINRGVEIDSELADGPNAVILDQVTNGVAIRMAVLAILAHANNGIAQR